MTEVITSERDLRKIIPKYPASLDRRIQSELDALSFEFISKSPFAILAVGDEAVDFQIIETVSLQASIDQATTFHFESEAANGSSFSLYFLVPGIGHGLRINGVYHHDSANHRNLSIQSVYFHCSRAFVRGSFWRNSDSSDFRAWLSNTETTTKSGQISTTIEAEHEQFFAQTSLMFLRTQHANGSSELSPRGDPAGELVKMVDGQLLYAERPGNKVAISLRNLLRCPSVNLLLCIPGNHKFLAIKGRGRLSKAKDLLAKFSHQNKTPKLCVCIDIESLVFVEPQLPLTQNLWNTETYVDPSSLTSFSKALSTHMNGTGLLGKATHTIVSTVVKHDLRHLY